MAFEVTRRIGPVAVELVFEFADDHGTGSFRVVAELLPYALSTTTGGAKDANVSASTQTFTVG